MYLYNNLYIFNYLYVCVKYCGLFILIFNKEYAWVIICNLRLLYPKINSKKLFNTVLKYVKLIFMVNFDNN